MKVQISAKASLVLDNLIRHTCARPLLSVPRKGEVGRHNVLVAALLNVGRGGLGAPLTCYSRSVALGNHMMESILSAQKWAHKHIFTFS